MFQKRKWREWIIAISLGVFYLGAVVKVPVSYWDEMIWVGRSYFVDYFLKGDLQNPVWQTIASYDQPKLGEYMYGLWIYPKYLYEKVVIKTGVSSYPVYLINQGFYQINESSFGEYKEYLKKKMPEMVKFDSNVNLDRGYYQQQYGDKALPTFDLVVYARRINILWLILAVFMAYKVIKIGLGSYWGMVGIVFYGINSLVVTWGLKAHAEGLFLFFFNATLWLIYKYFEKRDTKILLLLAITIGLCTNVKLSGLMLGLIFVGAYFIFNKVKFCWKSLVVNCSIILLVTGLLLVFLNPYIQSDPIGKFGSLFEKRALAANLQSEMFPDRALSSPMARIVRIGINFFSPEKMALFNGVYGIRTNSFILSLVLIIIFILGMRWVLSEAIKGNKFQQYMLLIGVGVVVTMSDYLLLDWERYYIQLVLPIVYFELIGAKILIPKLYRWIVKNYKKLWLVSGGVIIGLLMVEICLRAINYPLQNCRVINEASEYSIGKYDSELGWSYKEFTSVEQEGIEYDLGEEGQRLNKDITWKYNKDTKKVLVIGDSILFGHGINARDTFSEKLQNKLGSRYQVLNFSVQGYGTDQIFLRMAKLIPLYRPAIIITDYISDHNKRNVNEDRRYMFPCMKFSGTKPVFSVENGKLRQSAIPKSYAKFDRFKIGVAWQMFGESSRIRDWNYQKDLTKSLMSTMDDLASINKIKLLTIDFDSEMTEYQRQERLSSVVSIDNQVDKSLYISDGVHPNSKGTTVMLDKFWEKFGNLWF